MIFKNDFLQDIWEDSGQKLILKIDCVPEF